MSLGPNDPTPVPEHRIPTMREIVEQLHDLRRRVSAIERPQGQIIETVNDHSTRIESLEDDVSELKTVAAETNKALHTANAWHSGIAHGIDQLKALVTRLVTQIEAQRIADTKTAQTEVPK